MRKLASCSLATLAFLLAASAQADDTTTKTTATTADKTQPAASTQGEAMSPEDAEMMAKWQASMTPGEFHAKLEPLVGNWKTTSTAWMEPGAPPMTSTGTSETRWIFGGRYLQQSYRGTFMDQPFEGHGMTGYDNVQKKYVATWIDSMSTGMWTGRGDVDASGKKFTFNGEFWCPIAGEEVKTRSVITVHNKDKHVMEMWGPDPKTGKEHKHMELTYERVVSSAMK